MRHLGDAYLFNSGDLFDQINAWSKDLRNKVLNYPADALLNASVDSLVEYFTEQFSTSPLRLLEDEITADQTETDVDISQNHMYHVNDRSRPFYHRRTPRRRDAR